MAQEDSDEYSAQGDSDVNFSQEDSRFAELSTASVHNEQESTPVESGQSLRRMCIQPSRLIPSSKKIDDDDLSDEERGSNFQAGVATLQSKS